MPRQLRLETVAEFLERSIEEIRRGNGAAPGLTPREVAGARAGAKAIEEKLGGKRAVASVSEQELAAAELNGGRWRKDLIGLMRRHLGFCGGGRDG